MDSMILNSGVHRRSAEIEITPEMSLVPGRVHEFCGAARRRLALMVAARLSGPVIWIRPGWQAEGLNPEGVLTLMEPGRLIFVCPGRGEDLLWCMEEALRSGAVPLVVAELPVRPAMTPVRRLHLAAETGATQGRLRLLGVILSAGEGGAPGVESRWSLDPAHDPAHDPDTLRWRLQRRRSRTLPPKGWDLEGRS